jgi:hypothetical protein
MRTKTDGYTRVYSICFISPILNCSIFWTVSVRLASPGHVSLSQPSNHPLVWTPFCLARVQAHRGKNTGPACKEYRVFCKTPFCITRQNGPHSRVNCQKKTNDSDPNSKQTRIKMLRGFPDVFRIGTLCKGLRLTPKKQANQPASNNCQIFKCSSSIKFGIGKLGRISTENLSQTSNREGSPTSSPGPLYKGPGNEVGGKSYDYININLCFYRHCYK